MTVLYPLHLHRDFERRWAAMSIVLGANGAKVSRIALAGEDQPRVEAGIVQSNEMPASDDARPPR